MKLQKLCQILAGLAICGVAFADPPSSTNRNDYPTVARVEYVNNCMAKTSDKLAGMYQCACAIDRIAETLTYDDYVEDSTYARNSTLPGQGASIFRDSDEARQKAKRYRELESSALKGCGMRV